jgi:hypothetical protein
VRKAFQKKKAAMHTKKTLHKDETRASSTGSAGFTYCEATELWRVC